MDTDRPHEFKPTSWALCVELAAKTKILNLVCINFRHLKCDSLESILPCCKQAPEIQMSGVPQTVDNNSDAYRNVLKSYLCLPPSTKMTVDVSRNFFKELNVIDLLDTVFLAMQQNHIFSLQSITNSWVSTLNMSSNDLKTFPFSMCPKHIARKSYDYLKFIYLNHNHIEEIPVSISSSFDIYMPELEHFDLRNNRLISIQGLPCLLDHHRTLRHLSLSGNFLTTPCIKHLPFLPQLKLLGLFANRLDNPADMTPMHTLEDILNILKHRYPCLQELYLLGNPVVSKLDLSEYQAKVKEILPLLRYLDGIEC